MELSDFVTEYRVDHVSNPNFRFQFPVQDTFVFVEKQPLRTSGMRLNMFAGDSHFNPALVSYETRVGRESLEFRAGRLLAAYASTHPDLEIFMEDEKLFVYRIRNQAPAAQ